MSDVLRGMPKDARCFIKLTRTFVLSPLPEPKDLLFHYHYLLLRRLEPLLLVFLCLPFINASTDNGDGQLDVFHQKCEKQCERKSVCSILLV